MTFNRRSSPPPVVSFIEFLTRTRVWIFCSCRMINTRELRPSPSRFIGDLDSESASIPHARSADVDDGGGECRRGGGRQTSPEPAPSRTGEVGRAGDSRLPSLPTLGLAPRRNRHTPQ